MKGWRRQMFKGTNQYDCYDTHDNNIGIIPYSITK